MSLPMSDEPARCPGCPPELGVRADSPARHHTPGCRHAPHCPGCHTTGTDRGHQPTCPCAYDDHQIPAAVLGPLHTEADEINADDDNARRFYHHSRLVDLRRWLNGPLPIPPELDEWTVARRLRLMRAELEHREKTEWPGGRNLPRLDPVPPAAPAPADEPGPRYVTVSSEPHVWQIHDTHTRTTLPGRYDQATADQVAADLNDTPTTDHESRVMPR
jgi:hypothetical protein